MHEPAHSWRRTLDAVADAVAPHRGSGRVADYIPALANVDPQFFGMALTCHDGDDAWVEDAEVAFSIQSISKIFTLTLALRECGDDLWRGVWREPSGTPFNSIVQLESDKGVPRNPFINAGALVVTDRLITCFGKDQVIGVLVEFLARRADVDIRVDEVVAQSERETSHRNLGLAHVMKGFGNLQNAVDDVVDVYCRQCAIAMTCRDLARSALYLSAEGRDPIDDEAIVSPLIARRINALMLTCGHYDAAGDFAFRIGLPGKSGVGGGILALVPRQLALAVWSPGLNENGNSLVGTLALEAFVRESGLAIL
ncbi:MAG: glutaminase [Pirellulales bacterium]|nr:glutaminase [Pirellulales bacterium]